jgi:hypothetical protein
MTIDFEKIFAILRGARERGDQVLLEPQGLELLTALGIATPAHLFIRNSSEARVANTGAILSDRACSQSRTHRILHKTDVGGVRIVANDRDAIVTAIRNMERNLSAEDLVGFSISEFVDYDLGLGGELLLGLRWTDDFGSVVTLASGGIYAEFLSENFKEGRDVAILSPEASTAEDIERALQECAVTQILTTQIRGNLPRIGIAEISQVAEKFLALARAFAPEWISECEINPRSLLKEARCA